MSFALKEVILGASVPLTNGGSVTFSVAGHIEAERDIDDAVVIFGRKLLKYTNCATDEDRLTVRQIISSITSTPLDKVPDVGAGAPIPPPMEPAKTPLGSLPKKQDSGKAWVGEDDGRVLRLDKSAKTPAPVTLDQVSPLPERMPAPTAAEQAGAAPEPVPTAPPEPEASAPAAAPTAPPTLKPAPEGEVCERCGAAVTKSQAKLSQLFMSKTLCKTCMEAP